MGLWCSNVGSVFSNVVSCGFPVCVVVFQCGFCAGLQVSCGFPMRVVVFQCELWCSSLASCGFPMWVVVFQCVGCLCFTFFMWCAESPLVCLVVRCGLWFSLSFFAQHAVFQPFFLFTETNVFRSTRFLGSDRWF